MRSLPAGATIDLGNARAGDHAGELSRLGIDPAAVETKACDDDIAEACRAKRRLAEQEEADE